MSTGDNLSEIFREHALAIILAIVFATLGIVLTVYRTGSNIPGRSKRISQPAIIIVGPPGAGKTSLYTLVC